VELRDYWRIVRRRWRIVVACVVIALAVAAAVTFLATPQYSSTSSVFASTRLYESTDAYQGNLFATERVNSYASMVTKSWMANVVAAKLGNGVTAADLTGKVSASIEPNTVIVDITATDSDAKVARDIAQAYAVALRKEIEIIETPPGSVDSLVRATIVNPAQVPDSPVSPRPLRNFVVALLLGLIIGVAAALARERFDPALESLRSRRPWRTWKSWKSWKPREPREPREPRDDEPDVAQEPTSASSPSPRSKATSSSSGRTT
jgi:capsular polysaccharide biosynthesis protein